MANKREYTIVINGLKESYEGVKSLREALEGIDDRLVKVEQTTVKTSEAQKSQASSIDALSKAQQKLNEYDKAYQQELAKVNAELSANKKEINEAIKLQQAQDIVDAKQLDTYRDKQTYLSALNTLIRNHSTATEEDVQAIDKMVQESAQLQAELKATDETMQIYVRNVGNYNEAADRVVSSHKSVRQQLKEVRTEMTEMLVNGVSKTDEAYRELAERAIELAKAQKDAKEDIAEGITDTRALNGVINVATSAVNAWQLYNSVVALTGVENEEAAESMKKMMAIMTLLNSLQQVQNSLLENGSVTARLYTKAVGMISSYLGIKKTAIEADIAATEASTLVEEANAAAQEANATAQEVSAAAAEANTVSTTLNTTAEEANTVATGANSGALGTNSTALQANAASSNSAATATNTMTVAQKAGAIASKTLSVALRAIPLMAVIGLVMALIQNWESIWNWFKKTFPVLDTLSKKIKNFGGFLNALITAVKACAYAIKDFLITAVTSFGESLSLLFSGHWSEAVDKLKNIFKDSAKAGLDAANNELTKGFQKGEQERTAIAAEESNKRTKQELEELKIRERNNKTYSKKYIELQQKEFDERKKMAKGNQEELNKIKLEEMKFYADVEDKKTAYAKEQGKKRANDAKKAAKAAADAQKQAEKYKKMIDELQKANKKAIDEADKMVDDAIKKGYKAAGDAAKLKMDELLKVYREELGSSISAETALAKLQSDYEKSLKMYEYYVKRVEELTAEGNTEMAEGLKPLRDYLKNTVDLNAQMINEFTDLVNTATGEMEATLDKIQNVAMVRKSAIVNTFADQAVELKAKYIEAQTSLQAQIDETEEKIKTASGDTKLKLEADLNDLRSRMSFLLKAAKTELGDYWDEFMQTPVDVNIERITQWMSTLDLVGKKLVFTAADVQDALLGVDGTIERIVQESYKKGGIEAVVSNVRQLGKAANLSSNDINGLEDTIREKFSEIEKETDEYKKRLRLDDLSKDVEKDVNNLFSIVNSIQLNKFGTLAQGIKEQVTQLNREVSENIIKAYQKVIEIADQDITSYERNIKRFQEATKGVKFEPVMQDDAFSKVFRGQIIDLDKTRDRYDDLLDSYTKYRDSLDKGSEEMKNREAQWQVKLEASKRIMEETGKLYGKNSLEYKKAANDYEKLVDEKTKEEAAYAIEYEKAQQKVEEITKKTTDLIYDYWKSVGERISGIIKDIQDNVMSPIFDAMGDYFALQVEEAQQALDEIEELLDKATEARQESADRVKQINDEIKNSDASNKANLEQQLADEQVLLVQREEAERSLEKERKKRQYEVDMAEYNQRKFELKQKLAEGLVNTALGVTAALKYGPILGPIFAAIIGAMGAVQTAIIAKQIGNLKAPQKYAMGGLIGEEGISRSHSQGGHRIAGTNIEVEGGEWVINKKSSSKYDDLLRAINNDNTYLVRRQLQDIHERRTGSSVKGSISRYANGGRLDTVNTVQAVQATSDVAAISELIRQIDFEPVVSVREITKVQKGLVKVTDLAGKR